MKKINKKASETFRINLRLALDFRKVTITALAEKARDSRASVSQILSGAEGVGIDRGQRLAAVLDFTFAEMVSEKFEKKVLQSS